MEEVRQHRIAGLEIRRLPLASLHLDPANARAHPDANLEAIVASLRRFGQAEPLVIQKATGRIIGGNGRLVAMKQLGWNECDVVEVDVDDLTATSLGIALNRVPLAKILAGIGGESSGVITPSPAPAAGRVERTDERREVAGPRGSEA